MIFRSRRRNDLADTPARAGGDLDDLAADADGGAEQVTQTGDGDSGIEAAAAEAVDLYALDEADWRELGPYDITEVDTDALEDPEVDPARIDLGSIVLAAMNEMELRLQVDESSQQIVSAMMMVGESALEVGAFAAPRSGGLWAEVRDELVDTAEEAGGSANLVAGPFGVELRRVLPVQTPDGQPGYQPSRMWVAEGPRWMLRGILYGEAALEDGLDGPVAELLEAFRQIVVRRGEDAMAPGDLLPLSLPEDILQAAPEAATLTGDE